MTTYYEKGDAIQGDKIVGIARKINKPKVVVRTGSHKSIQITLEENAFCVIDKKSRFLPQF